MAFSVRKKCIILGIVLGSIAPLAVMKPIFFRYLGYSALASALDGFAYRYYSYFVALPLAIYLVYAFSSLKYEDKDHHPHYRWRSLVIGLLFFIGVNLGLSYVLVPRVQKLEERMHLATEEDITTTQKAS